MPTVYENIGGEVIATNQYSITEHVRVLPPIDHNQPGPSACCFGVLFSRHDHSFVSHVIRIRILRIIIGHEHTLPGVYFLYDLSPIMIQYTERRKSFTHFLTGAILSHLFML